jgi:glutathione S-transferase
MLKAQMDQHFQILDEMLIEHRFLLGEKPSLADFAVYGAIIPLSYSGNRISEEFKSLAAWHQTVEKF